ncbi:MAG: ATP-binding protein [Nitrospirota bacterium]|nr:ATP-binding protein [Nitrospirota bacterium]MDH5585355.1 ATP-binding protein [Nitrospirota bacterium]
MAHTNLSPRPLSLLSRLRGKWQGNLRFRHTIILSSIILIIMTLLAGIMLSKQRAMLYHAAETKGLAFTQAFAIGGWAALQNNLFRIQEALMSYPPDPDIVGIDVVDDDSMIMASQIPSRIGLTLEDPQWVEMKQQQEKVLRYTKSEKGEPILIMVAPLLGDKETNAWIRVSFSLQNVREQDLQLMVNMSLMTILLIGAGLLSLYWSKHHISSILQSVIDQLQHSLGTRTELGGYASSLIASEPETIGHRGDLEHLEHTVTKTIGLLKTQSTALQHSATALEQTVKERTKALLETKQSLEAEVQERQLASEQLEKMSRQNQLILNSAGEGIYGLNVHGRVTFINPAGAKLLGYDIEELLGKPMHETMHHTKRDGSLYPRHLCPLHGNFLRNQSHGGDEEVLWRKDGTSFPVEYISTPIHEGEKIVGAVVSFSDITLRRKAEDKIRKSETKLRQTQKMEAMGTLAGGIAHDFNNILTAMLGFSQLAQLKLSPSEQSYEYLNQVLVAGKRAKDLIKQILTFSRQTEPAHQPLQLSPLLEEVLTLMQATLPATIEIHKDFSEDIGMVLADPIQLHQVFMNLFANAEHAMREKSGRIMVKLDHLLLDQDNQGKYPELSLGPYFRISVADTGTGIPAQTLARIFDPFFTTKEVGDGTGMGLSVAHGIIVAHGGTITVESQVGQGTTFSIFLPYIDATPKSPSEQTELFQYPKQHGHILFVDDEEALSSMGKHFLEHLGYTVTVCSNGLTALEIFQSNPHQFDAVITDQTMPKLTGEKLAVELLRLNPDVPIIIYTGFSHTITLEKAQQLGIRRLLHKPLLIQELATTLEEILQQKV